MLIHNEKEFTIFFGNKSQAIQTDQFEWLSHCNLIQTKPFDLIAQTLHLKVLIFCKQTHSINGYEITHPLLKSFLQEGDYLITQLKNIGIGVMTADCAPIVLIDKQKMVGGVIHAGWRGAVGGILPKAIEHLEKRYGSHRENLTIFIGPSAQICCYEIQKDFISNISPYPWANQTYQIRDTRYYFNLIEFLRLQLADLGIAHRLNTNYVKCTICNPSFCSYRRSCYEKLPESGEIHARQATILVLKETP